MLWLLVMALVTLIAGKRRRKRDYSGTADSTKPPFVSLAECALRTAKLFFGITFLRSLETRLEWVAEPSHHNLSP